MANRITKITKDTGTYPANVSFFDVTIPTLADITKALVFVNFGYSAINDAAFTLRSFEIINTTTLRIFGRSDIATGNVAVEFAYTILEFTADSDIVTQRVSRFYTGGESEGEKDVTISAVTLANAGSLYSGYNYASSDTTFGNEEMTRSRIKDSTTWSTLIDNTPSSDATVRAQIADWGAGVSVQRGLVTMGDTESITVNPPTGIDRTRTIMVFSYTSLDGDFSIRPEDFALTGTINGSGNMVFTRRNAGEDRDIRIAWELWEFPVDEILVQYGSIFMNDGTSTATDTITTVDDLAKSMVHSPSQTPFGMGIGNSDEDTEGDFGEATAELTFDDASTIRARRETSARQFDIEFQVIEWLLNPVNNFTVDAILILIQENTSLVDAIIVNRNDEDFTVDALVGLVTVDFNYTIDSIISQRLTTAYTVDSFIRLQQTTVFSTDAMIQSLGINGVCGDPIYF